MVFFLEFWIEKMVRRVWVIVLAIKEGIILFVGAYDSDTIKGIREKKILWMTLANFINEGNTLFIDVQAMQARSP